MPAVWRTRSRSKFSGTDALLILLARFANPDRWRTHERLFGRSEQELSACFNSVLVWVHRRNYLRMRGLNCLWEDDRIRSYIAAVSNITGHRHEFVFAWIDGFFLQCARPTGPYWIQVRSLPALAQLPSCRNFFTTATSMRMAGRARGSVCHVVSLLSSLIWSVAPPTTWRELA